MAHRVSVATVEQALKEKLLSEASGNPYRNTSTGQYTSGGGGGAGVGLGGEKFTSASTVISDSEAATIQKHVDTLPKDADSNQLDAALNRCYGELGEASPQMKSRLEARYNSDMEAWTVHGVDSGNGGEMGALANGVFGMSAKANFSPAQQGLSTGMVDKYAIKNHAIGQSFQQAYIEKHYGKTMTVYRGVHGDQASTVLASAKGGKASVGTYSLSSWSTDKGLATTYAKQGKGKGAIMTAKVKTSDMFSHNKSNSALKALSSAEVIVHTKTGSRDVSVAEV